MPTPKQYGTTQVGKVPSVRVPVKQDRRVAVHRAPCPVCHAEPDAPCMRVSDGQPMARQSTHIPRRRIAIRLGY